jgi:hypothetical protein
MNTLADRIIAFNQQLEFPRHLPEGIHVLNTFVSSPLALECSSAFYRKYYSDNEPRHMILGINPGRFGSGMTGIAFTDPKRLDEEWQKRFAGQMTHEPSSEYVYQVIAAYGGIADFYRRFYINSVCPLGFTTSSEKGKEVNYNYYDRADLKAAARPFIIESIRKQIDMGMRTDTCFCFGTGHNFQYLDRLNKELGFFDRVIPLEHPRYIMQYQSKNKQFYIDKYLEEFNKLLIGNK